MQLSDRFIKGEHSPVFKAYRDKRYSQYGYPKAHAIEYNRETEDNRYRWASRSNRKQEKRQRVLRRMGVK